MSLSFKVAVVQLSELNIDRKGVIDAKHLFEHPNEIKNKLENLDIDQIKREQVVKIKKYIQIAASNQCSIIVFPELALTSFFPYLYINDTTLLNKFFEIGDITRGVGKEIFDLAKKLEIVVAFGYAELTMSGERYNSYVLQDVVGNIFNYRKTHIPGFEKPSPDMPLFQFEKGQFRSSNEGYPVFTINIKNNKGIIKSVRTGIMICHDRRYNAPYLAMGMKRAQLVINGYNTPVSLSFQRKLDDYVYNFHYLPQQAQAITEGFYILSSARAGNIFGIGQIAGSCIISPEGEILVKEEDVKEAIISCDIDLSKCQVVKAQKYWGDRAKYEVILTELIRYKGLNEVMNILDGVYTKSLLHATCKKIYL